MSNFFARPELRVYFANTSWLLGEPILRIPISLLVGIETERLDTNNFIDYLSRNTYLHIIFIDDGSTDNTNLIIN